MLLNFNYSSLKIEETIKFILRILYCQMRYQDILNMEKRSFCPPLIITREFRYLPKNLGLHFLFLQVPYRSVRIFVYLMGYLL